MKRMEPTKPGFEYRCPGQSCPISRAVHLARMAAYYPSCRQCPYGSDTGGLSRRLVRRLRKTREMAKDRSEPLFFEEGAAGAYLNDIGPVEAEKMAAALGMTLRETGPRDETGPLDEPGPRDTAEPPVAVVAGDGRPITPELVAAVAEGLRWSGCHVVDIGQASAACAAFAVGHFQADGGLLVGNPGHGPQTVGLKFWSAGGRPMSLGGVDPSLDEVRRTYETGADRPCRRYGSLRRLQVEDSYLATFGDHYHALRPLRLLLDCACRPLVEYLQRLTKPLACEVLVYRGREVEVGRAVRKNEAHLAAVIEGDGETCRVLDERGQNVDADRLVELIGRHVAAQIVDAAIVLEPETRHEAAKSLARVAVVKIGGARRAGIAREMIASDAAFAGGPSGRFWYATDGVPVPDALMTVTLLLEILSQSDRRMSSVLDD